MFTYNIYKNQLTKNKMKIFKDGTNDRVKRLHLISNKNNNHVYINKYKHSSLNYTEMLVIGLNGIVLASIIIENKLQLFEMIHKFM